MRRRHDVSKFPHRPYKLVTADGTCVVVYFEKDPNKLYDRSNVDSRGFKDLLLKQFDYYMRGCGRDRFRKLLAIKERWESGSGAVTSPPYVPSPCFMALGKTLDPSKGEVSFRHKDYQAFPQLV